MLIDEIKGIDSSRSELRKFGFIMAGALAVLWGILLYKDKAYCWYLFGGAFLPLLTGLFAPMILKPFQKVWMTIAIVMGWIMTRIILSILFYLILTPIGLIMRLLGKDILNMKLDAESPSYWIPRQTDISEKRDYEKQF